LTIFSGAGTAGPRVFIADDAPDTFEFLKTAVVGEAGWVVAGEARTLDAFIEHAGEAATDVWLVSSAWLGLMSRDGLKRATSANPEGILLAVTDTKDYAELKAALRRGARDVIVAGASAEEVRDLIESHYREARGRQELISLQAPVVAAEDGLIEIDAGRGRVVLITGGDGGTGKSFIAAQLAGIVARHTEAKTCLVDLDCEFGSLSATLGMADCERSLGDLAAVADELVAGQVESVLVNHSAGFSLAPGAAYGGAEGLRDHATVPVKEILDLLKELFDVVICDAPPAMCGAAILDEADDVFIVATPDRTSAHCAGRLGGRIAGSRLIVNMADRRGALAGAKMSELCGLPVTAVVPEDTGAGRLFDKNGDILADRTNLAITRSLIPIAQRCRHFDELIPAKRLSWLPVMS
jgi:pilus assembly protein CpaE